ncbi:MAG: TonB-dependent receptor [Taibaiella sp.]|nr:TonB-dependent receptor [Taibaiella sp.]
MKHTIHLKSSGLTALILFFCSVLAVAQTGTIKGFVYDKKTGEPLIGTNIMIVNNKSGVQSDNNGYFSLTLPSGSYTIMASALGYDSSLITVNLLPDAIITKKILLAQKGIELNAVEISSRKMDKTTRINTGLTKITPQEMKKLPSAGGEPDLAQYLQVIPGVVFTGDQGGQLFIRGGSPAQTGIYIDGVTIYNPFHSIGLFSVFETEAVRSVDVYTAGYGAQYGNRTSAIVDVHYKDGNKNNLAGIVSVSPIMSRIMLEGPLLKSKKDNGAGITFLVSGKTSYLDKTSKSLYGGLNETFKNGLPYSFTDLYGKVTFNGDNGSKLNLFAFNFDDNASLLNETTHTPDGNYHWKTLGAGATFVVSPANTAALIDGKFAYSNYDISLQQVGVPADTVPSTSKINGFESAINFTYFLPHYSQIKYGIEVNGIHTALNYYSAAGVSSTLNRQSTTASLYFLYRQVVNGKFIFEPSFRVQYYSELNKISPQPRLGLKYNITDNIRLKGATGLYAQNIISTKTDRDIVNLFTGFLLSPDQQIKDADNQEVKSNLQTSFHAVTGVEWDIDRVELNLEPWIKIFGQINELNRNKIFPNEPDFVAASGKAYGLDLSAKYNYKRIYLWGAAGYQMVRYTSIGPDGKKQTYPTPFDTRLNANALISYTAGKKKDWEVSARFNVHSPFPFTQTQGFYENLNVSNNGLSSNVNTQNGSITPLYANEINGGRLSWYHRIDLSAKKHFMFKNKTGIDVTGSVTNAYDRNNIFYVNRITNGRVYQLPLFPSVNVTWNF